MGDRVYASISFGGHIETVEEMEKFLQALGEYGVNDNNNERHISDTESARVSVREAVEQGYAPDFYDHEVNYGTFDDLESMVDEIPGLGCSTSYNAGGGFASGVKTVMPDGIEHHASSDEGYPTARLDELVKARSSDDVLAALDKIIADLSLAGGDSMPAFTVSPAVAAWLKIFGVAA